MNLSMGRHVFKNVTIPLLWGTRAVVQDKERRLSIIDLAGPVARLEILAGRPAPGIDFRLAIDGTIILSPGGDELYRFDNSQGALFSIGLGLPDCRIMDSQIVIGSNVFAGNVVQGFGVGIAVTHEGIILGGPLPSGLATLAV